MSLTLSQYQIEAHKTAIYAKGHPEGINQVDYLLNAVWGESGELAEALMRLKCASARVSEAIKKDIRDNNSNSLDDLRKKVILEAGDVWWYLAETTTHMELQLLNVVSRGHYLLADDEPENDLLCCVLQIAAAIGKAIDIYLQNRCYPDCGIPYPATVELEIMDALGKAGYHLQRIAILLGIPQAQILQSNLAKVRSRLERGVIQGEGDVR